MAELERQEYNPAISKQRLSRIMRLWESFKIEVGLEGDVILDARRLNQNEVTSLNAHRETRTENVTAWHQLHDNEFLPGEKV